MKRTSMWDWLVYVVCSINACLAIKYYAKWYSSDEPRRANARLLWKVERALAQHGLFYNEFADGNVHIGMEKHFSSIPCRTCRAGELAACDACLGQGYRVLGGGS